MDVNVNVYRATATAQRDRALALSRKCVVPRRAPAAQRQNHGRAVINIDEARMGVSPFSQAYAAEQRPVRRSHASWY